ncbi:glycosyltransferase family 2 protein [Carboxylicivirga sp. N1Y90]|uniref:glycosyltransferase family 2 protein n=1 Tax=Carboxylicivirga fragile TaxID=3417571 RepID=UPI003D3561D8|nr:glycosyltransferase family 2 protein [Marinilabiliaceae bacterium N1Y90]
MSFPNVSLFLTTYNWPEALSLCLQSIAQQSMLPDEVIIADDGSKSDTKELVDLISKDFPCPIVHVWQEDEGFRINTIRNRAIKAAKYPYIIQIDGDVILDPDFVKDHLSFAKENRFVAGRRQGISEDDTKQFCKTLVYPKLKAKRSKLVAMLHQQLLYNSKSVRGVRGCNMAYWKKDAEQVNGFDASWEGKGPDDKEFAIRLTHANVKIYNLKYYAIQHHLYHGEEGLLDNYKKNQGYFAETINQKLIHAKNGLKELA